ncbi:hypothetical protein E1A91_A05G423000v1 [Gossypium mustelinum]|uniref:Uncharacterized protein n=1 Tax=Gossypium mustelinum TaxID=34275 RepID=A0A5D2ZIM5_GOSMU|nr:hypothetical protein E1A91_A05G423000v1 [Gossypium mustelinum]
MELQINTHFYLSSRSRKTQKFLQPKTPHRAPFKTEKPCPQDLWPSKLLPLPHRTFPPLCVYFGLARVPRPWL